MNFHDQCEITSELIICTTSPNQLQVQYMLRQVFSIQIWRQSFRALYMYVKVRMNGNDNILCYSLYSWFYHLKNYVNAVEKKETRKGATMKCCQKLVAMSVDRPPAEMQILFGLSKL